MFLLEEILLLPFSIRGALYSADGDIVIYSTKEVVKCCAGRTPWMLLRFALGRKEESIDGFDKQYLAILGFSLRSAKDQLAVADVADKTGKGRSVVTDDKVAFVHCCCEKENIFLNLLKGKE